MNYYVIIKWFHEWKVFEIKPNKSLISAVMPDTNIYRQGEINKSTTWQHSY